MDPTMQGRVTLVAGAAGGVGRAITSELLAAGAEVIMVGRSETRLRAAIPDPEPHKISHVVADLTDPSAVEMVRSKVAQRGQLDALVLSSGIYERSNKSKRSASR